MKKTPQIGKDIDSWCTRCKLVLAHTVEAVADGKATRVHCNTCGGQHAYRPDAPKERATASERATAGGKRAATTGRRSSRSSATTRAEPDYRSLIGNRTAANSRQYSSTQRFKAGEVIAHATFGLGAITAIKDPSKIEVLFADGTRVLAQGRSG